MKNEPNRCPCGGRVMLRYRKNQDPKFYCNKCGKNFTEMNRGRLYRD